ncbi:hypothetical protein, partial [Clostridium botulinum]
LKNKPAEYTPQIVTSIIEDVIINNDLIIAREDLTKEDKEAGYFDLEMKLSTVITYFYNEFVTNNKNIEGEFDENTTDFITNSTAVSYTLYEWWYLLKNYLPKRTYADFKKQYPFIMQVINHGKDMSKVLDKLESTRLSPKPTLDL